MKHLFAIAISIPFLSLAACTSLELGGHADHAGGAATDQRHKLSFPAQMRDHTLSSMRDHLLALAQIQEAMAKGELERAAEIAESRLGMSSLKAHGAHDSSKLMPQGMQDIGTSMHRSASRFAIQAANAAATGELKPALLELSTLTHACTACHAAYRLH